MTSISSRISQNESRRRSAAAFTASRAHLAECAPKYLLFLFAVLTAFFFAGCITEDESLLPWGAPSPSDGSVNLPRAMRGE